MDRQQQASLFAQHLSRLAEATAESLTSTGFDAVVLSSGTPLVYFSDDESAPFRPNPHFAHWCPMEGPHHLLQFEPGKRPLIVRYAPEDFWYEQTPLQDPFWAAEFESVEVSDLSRRAEPFKPMKSRRIAYVGDEGSLFREEGWIPNPKELTSRLDWTRSFKTDYEVQCLSQANALAAQGHLAARDAFFQGGSELQIHHAFVASLQVPDDDLPYTNIVALDEKGATLHYQKKRRKRDGDVLLIDAGARVLGYASDITRTYAREKAPEAFRALIQGMNTIQQEICDSVRPGKRYLDLHLDAHQRITGLLRDSDLLHASPEQAMRDGFSRVFFPHGLGHLLGIQVHDVGGHQANPTGKPAPPPEAHPFLRNTRPVLPGQVFTIEPGLYFIPMLLRPFRNGEHSRHFNWSLIDELTRCGGIRIEDNLVVTETGSRNLTREHLTEGS